MGTVSASTQPAQRAAQVRHRLVAQAVTAMDSLLGVVQARLTALMNEAAPSREMQMRRDAWMAYQRFKSRWRDGTVPVSYTHLDVYKRQGIMTSMFSGVFFSRGLVNFWYGRKNRLKTVSIGTVWRPDTGTALKSE